MNLRLSTEPEALLAERDRLEDLLQSSDDWRALMQLRARRARGEDLSSLSSSQLEALLLDALAENPFYQRRERIVAELDSLARYAPLASKLAPSPSKPDEARVQTSPQPLPAAAPAPAVDDLTRIRGIDAALMRRLHALDVWSYEDIADWWASDVHYISSTLGVGSRISAQNWIEQAAMLSMARPGGPLQSKKAIAAAKAKAEAEAKAAAEAARLAAEAKVREAAEAKARAEAEKAAAEARLAAEAAAKKVAEAAARIAAEAKAAAAARAEAEIAARARAETEARAKAEAEARVRAEAAARAVAEQAATRDVPPAAVKTDASAAPKSQAQPIILDLKPEPVAEPENRQTGTTNVAPVVSIPAAVPTNLKSLLAEFESKAPTAKAASAAPASRTQANVSGQSGIQIPRPVAETIFRSAGKSAETGKNAEPGEALPARAGSTDAEVVEQRSKTSAPAGAVAQVPPALPQNPPANPKASIDDAIRSAVMAASKLTRNGAPFPASTELAPHAPHSGSQSQRGELLPPISRDSSPESTAVRVRERMSDDLAEVIFDSTRYAAYRNKPEEANVNIVRRQRRDTPRVLPPPVPTAAIEARSELKGSGTIDRFLKALKGD